MVGFSFLVTGVCLLVKAVTAKVGRGVWSGEWSLALTGSQITEEGKKKICHLQISSSLLYSTSSVSTSAFVSPEGE